MRTLVVGLGNDDRGDDGVGLEIARRLAPLLGGAAEVRAHPGEPIDLIIAWSRADLLVLIDAARGGLRPGAVRRYELGRDTLPAGGVGSSTHAFDLLVAVELASALGLLPDRLVLFAVEGERFGLGQPRSTATEQAIEATIDLVRHEIATARPAAGQVVDTGGNDVHA